MRNYLFVICDHKIFVICDFSKESACTAPTGKGCYFMCGPNIEIQTNMHSRLAIQML